MKLLHTSDWHLGQSLNQFERGFEHVQFLAWLLDTLQAEQVDALLIAGDLFDNTNPSAASQNQLYQFLTQARQRVPRLSIVLTAGNHDSPGRLEAPAPFLSLLDAHVVGHVPRTPEGIDLDRLVLPLKDHAGQVAAWCIAMPFLRPGDVPQVADAPDAYMAGMAAIYAQAYELACQKRTPGQAIVAMGHCHITGGQVSEESERRIVIGGSEALSASVFAPGVAYVALGHLHLAQKLGGDATRRYCGSPLPMSFSEVDYPHQVVVVELEGDVVLSTREIRIPRSVELLRVPRQPAPLEQVLAELQALSLPPDLPPAQWPFLLVRVQLSAPEPGLRALVEAALADKPVRLVRIETSSAKSGQVETAALVSVDELANLAPAGFFERLYQHRFGEAPPPELMAAFTELVNLAPQGEPS
nr:exonuclease SbcCD subunit D C-terminal domain-containing protein [uncultured Rhodoferax sp.]